MRTAIIGGIAAAAIGAAALAVPAAHADNSTYLERVQAKTPYVLSQYGSTAVLNEGYRICGYESHGVTGTSDLADLTVAEMPMSRSAAIELQVLAEIYLGC
jgi:hypothetical protein